MMRLSAIVDKKVSAHPGAALPVPSEEPATEFAARAKAAWARLIRKVYETEPLECPALDLARPGRGRPGRAD